MRVDGDDEIKSLETKDRRKADSELKALVN